MARAGLVALLAAVSTVAAADEGQWTPEQIHELDFEALRGSGLELTAEEIWSEQGGLLRAAINFSGCSAAFVSKTGLIATNHHCAHSAIQSQSSVDHDYLTDGFLAADQAGELEAKGKVVRVMQSIEDVSEQFKAAIDGAKGAEERSRAADRLEKTLVADCEQRNPAARCKVGKFYNGKEYRLFEALELRDIRLVYAPPAGIGEFGGEIDNWMWPRHTGDFALLRAYVGSDGKPADFAEANVPYQPQHWLQVGHEGVRPGDFVAVLGYPGSTNRYLGTREVERHLEQVFPAKIEVYGEWIEILTRLGEADPAVKIKVASLRKRLANRHKNSRGMVAGIRRMKLLDRRRNEEAELRKWVTETDPGKHYKGVLDELEALTKEKRSSYLRDFLLSSSKQGPLLLAVAIDLVRWARERPKPDLERESDYMDRERDKLWQRLERRLRNFDAGVDAALLGSLLKHLGELPPQLRVAGTAGLDGAAIVRKTKLGDLERVRALFEAADAEAIARSSDPMIVLASALADAIEAKEAEARVRDGRELVIGPRYFEMLRAVRSGPIYPDANGTLRISFASVKGYEPRDGLRATPQTALAGQVEKHTGVEPFILPKAVLDAAANAKETYWADPDLEDVPVCFLSNADTTGGNSGSPVINGRGQLVGLNFDRVWENIAGDFGYNPPRSRNISVDIRYLLWLLDDVVGAQRILDEIGVSEQREARRRPHPNAPQVPAAMLQAHDNDAGAGCGCRHSADRRSWGWLVLIVVPAVRIKRRRRRGRLRPR